MSKIEKTFQAIPLGNNKPKEVYMTKTRCFLLAASIMLALAFTLSCSDDKSDTPTYGAGACYVASTPFGEDVQMCMKMSFDVSEEACQDMENRAGEKGMSGISYVESCPPNHTLGCTADDNFVYLYGQVPSGITCETFND